MGAITIPSGSNSDDSARLQAATHTTEDTLSASHALLITFCLLVLLSALSALPWTFFRLQHAGWLTGWSLRSKRVQTPIAKYDPNQPKPTAILPRRIGRLPLTLPTYIIPYIHLSIPKACLLVCATIIIFIASFANSNVVSDSTRTGYIAITLVPCVIALGNKVWGVGTVIQVGYASVNWLHRWLGRLLFFITTVHVIAYFIIFAQTHSMKEEMSKPANVLATVSYIGFCLIFFASIGYVRRRWWHVFKVLHHFGIFLFVVGLNYHSAILRPWVGFSVAFLGLSVVFRMLTSRLHIAYLTPLESSKSTIVHIPGVRSGWIPGQHVRIRVLTGGMGLGSIWEGHPFTLATAPTAEAEGAKLVVKVAGNWTSKLFDVAKKRSKGDVEGRGPYPVAVLIEGPYGGCNLVYSAYSSVLLAGGGSGVSYVLGTAQGVIADAVQGKSCTQHLRIVWSVRDRAAVNDMLPSFEVLLSAARSAPHLTVSITLYFTSVSRGLIIRPFSALPSSAVFLASTQRSSLAPTPHAPSPLSGISPFNSTTTLLGPGNSSRVDLDESSPQFVLGKADEDDSPAPQEEKKTRENPFTDAHAPSFQPAAVELKPGRPDYASILEEIVARETVRSNSFDEKFRGEKRHVGGVAVGACGPGGMVASLRKLCLSTEGVEFHAEEFSL